MERGWQFLPAGGLLELAGVTTWITNEESFMPYADIGFEIPVYLASADVQGGLLFGLGAILTSYGVIQMKK